MKKLIRTLTLTIGVCLALLCSVQAIEPKTGIGIVETNGLRLRAKPSTEADILDNASYGDNVVIIRESRSAISTSSTITCRSAIWPRAM